MAGQRFDQEGEGHAAGHVGVQFRFRRTQRAEAAGGGCLGGGHHRGGDGADFYADAAWEGEPVGGGGEVEGEQLNSPIGMVSEPVKIGSGSSGTNETLAGSCI